MNAAKKIEIENLPQDFSPQTLPEILKLAKKIKGDVALIYERLNKPFFMETDRLIIRRFTTEDTEAVFELSNDRNNSSMKNFDHQWPTDMEGCKGATAYFAGEDIYYAVCLKPSMKLIGFIAYNSVTDDGILDLGHVWHTAYQDNDLDTEALSLMTQYAFEKLGANGVTAGNPLECEEQIAPLKTLGMEITEIRESASFVNDEHGNPIKFTGCKMLITREKWEAKNPESYSPKNKPEILNMMENANADLEKQAKIVPTASTIPQAERNTVRIIELPACKMVTSGPANGENAFAPEGALMRFLNWFTEIDKQRADMFYPRNFMWSPPTGGFQWGYAVSEIPKNTGGLDVIDFPGGLYAVAISVDADGADHDRVYNGILEWVEKSGCFVLDETNERRSLGNITSPAYIKDFMGYAQMDLYFPIKIKDGDSE